MAGLQEFLKALANETRQNIFFKVFSNSDEYTVGQVVEIMNLGQSTTLE